jgi:hypothetical protein
MVRQAHHERLKVPRVFRLDSKLTDRCTDEASLNIVASILEATKGWMTNLLTAV